MNIKDYPEKFTEETSKDGIVFIFKRQKELMLKYRDIEKENGFFYPENLKVDLDSMQDQTLLKNMSWRFIEELGESIEALEDLFDEEHFKEESIDALHFLTELLILSGLDYKYFQEYFNAKLGKDFSKDENSRTFNLRLKKIIKYIGTAMNCLKMKPWSKSHNLTDSIKYIERLKITYFVFIDYLFTLMSGEEILNFYFKKSEVNKFRQNSNY